MPTPAPQGFPPVIGVPALYRIVRCIPVEGTIVTTVANASPLPADMLAEVQALYSSATEQQIKTAGIVVKQVDIQNTGYDDQGSAQTALVEYIERLSVIGNAPLATGGYNLIPPGASASYPSPMRRGIPQAAKQFSLKCSTPPARPQMVNAIIWFDVPGFGS